MFFDNFWFSMTSCDELCYVLGGNDLSTDDAGSLPAKRLVLPRNEINFKDLSDSFLWKLF